MSGVNLKGIHLALGQVYSVLAAGRTAPSARRAAVKRPTIPKFWLRDLQLGEEELLARDPVQSNSRG